MTVTTPVIKDVVITTPYVCQIHSRRHIDVCAIEDGYLQEVRVKEGQAVKKDELLFKIMPVLYQARLDAEKAKVRAAEVELENSKILQGKNVVSNVDVQLHEAKLKEAEAERDRAQAELLFTDIKAPFDGIADRQMQQLGSLVKEGDVLTNLSDNSVMWVYFPLHEEQYLEYMAMSQQEKDEQRLQLKLADGSNFDQPGKIGAIEGTFNNTTGTIAFRADFPNPNSLLRHGQTGTILMSQPLHNALIIPQRAVYEILDKQYVYVLTDGDIVKQRGIEVQKNALEDIFVVESGLEVGDKIVLEGKRQVRDGDNVEYEFVAPEEALKELKFHAE
ncbi:MAG: efflux RND transporter periplasmic adaptor subunit [Planctomycetaceae bacterium]